MSPAERTAARRAILEVVLRRCRELALPPGARVAAYQPLPTEPGSVELLEALHSAGYQVLVPHTLPDRDLDWLPWPRPAAASAPAETRPSGEPTGGSAEPTGGSGELTGGYAELASTSGEPTGGSELTGAPGERAGAPVSPAGPLRPPTRGPSDDALGVAAIGTAALLLVPAFAVDRQGHRLGRGGGSYDRALARVPAGTVVAALVFETELVERVPTDPWDRSVTAAVRPSGWLEFTESGRRNT